MGNITPNTNKELEARAKRIWKLRQLTGLIRMDFAKRHSLDVDRVKNWEEPTGDDISAQEAKDLIAALKKEGIHCSEEWVLQGMGNAPEIKMSF